jgi:hypothetical protein
VMFFALAMTACGSDNKSSGGDNRSKTGACYGTTGQTCTGTAEYETCMTNACDAKIKACFGNDYQSGSYGGSCADMIKCYVACKCDATYNTCAGNCTTQYASNTACQTCMTDMTACLMAANCKQPTCTAGGSDGGSITKDGTIVTGDCASLAACCKTVASAYKAPCDQVVATGNAQACSINFTAWKQAGICQ